MRRRPFSPPYGYGRLVGTPEQVAEALGVPADDLLRAIVAAGVEAWGANGRGEAVWAVRDARRAAGLPEPPPPRRGDRRFGVSIPGAKRRWSGQEPLGGLEGGREWPPSIEEV